MDFLSCEQPRFALAVERRNQEVDYACMDINLQQLPSWLGQNLIIHFEAVVPRGAHILIISPHMVDIMEPLCVNKYFIILSIELGFYIIRVTEK